MSQDENQQTGNQQTSEAAVAPRVIVPTVGRRVWYRPSTWDKTGPGAMTTSGDAPLDAGVLAVWGDRCVNVEVTDIMGKKFTKTSITLRQPDDAAPHRDAEGKDLGGYVEWMPYQSGQAAKS